MHKYSQQAGHRPMGVGQSRVSYRGAPKSASAHLVEQALNANVRALDDAYLHRYAAYQSHDGSSIRRHLEQQLRIERALELPELPSPFTLAAAVQEAVSAYITATRSNRLAEARELLSNNCLRVAREQGTRLSFPGRRSLARWAVSKVINDNLAFHLRGVHGLGAPRRWRWHSALRDSALVGQGCDREFIPVLKAVHLQALVDEATDLDLGDLLEDGGPLHDPDWSIPYAYGRTLDPVRWPMLCSWLVAQIISHDERLSDQHNSRVIAVEAGHSVSAQSLAAWLPQGVRVGTERVVPRLEGQRRITRSETARAVVIGGPTLRAVRYTTLASFDDFRLTGGSHQRLLQTEPYDINAYVEVLVRPSLDLVQADGLAFVIGDPEVHHQATALVDSDRRFQRHEVTTDKPIVVQRPKAPWRPWGVMPPSTQRLITVWRRAA